MSRAQLQAHTTAILDARPEVWFEVHLPGLLSAHRDLARSFGGRYGFIVGPRQWIVDLDYAVVEGDRLTACVDESDQVDAVLCVEARDLERVLRGSHGHAPSLVLTEGDPELVERLRAFLDACAEPKR